MTLGNRPAGMRFIYNAALTNFLPQYAMDEG